MKTFYTRPAAGRLQPHGDSSQAPDALAGEAQEIESRVSSSARIAVYDAPAAAPRVVEVPHTEPGQFIEDLSSHIYELSRGGGGDVPYTVVRELTENLIHADFAEPVVSILDSGRTIRFADQGPGIRDKGKAVLPGFTTAAGHMKRHIRGVGSGLPIVSDFLSHSGGSLLIEDNLGSGAVVTITTASGLCTPESLVAEPTLAGRHEAGGRTAVGSRYSDQRVADSISSRASDDGVLPFDLDEPAPVAPVRLTNRQKQVLALVLESGSAGPSIVSRELGVGLSTAYRDLASLEDLGLILSVGGKRTLTDKGMDLLDDVLSVSDHSLS